MKPFLLAKRFVAGTTLTEALAAAQTLHAKGLHVTLDHLGEDVTDTKEAEKATNAYLTILTTVRKKKTNVNIAVKLSQIGLAINQKLALRNLYRILTTAKKNNIRVEIDMEGSKYTKNTLACYLSILKHFPTTILALQAYLYRTYNDLLAVAKKNGNVRIIKGAYKEKVSIAFQDKTAVNKNYVALAEYALQHCKVTYIGTHNETIINHLKNVIHHYKIPKKKYEFQMLYGIRPGLQERLVSDGHPVRVYLPYGEAWFPYFSRRMRERKENFYFVLKNMFRR